MKWIVTKDQTEFDPTAIGPGSCVGKCATGWLKTPFDINEYSKELPFFFRLLDDDRNVNLEGHCGDLDDEYADDAYEPLDWAEEKLGCTEMQYRKKGTDKWQTL